MIYKTKGDILLSVLIFSAVAITIVIGLTNWGASMLRSIRTVAQKEQAFQVAEAGLDYYQWHLAQYPSDYKDGTATSGPYVHNFYDKDGNLIGTYSLNIIPPPPGSTVVKISSTGTIASSTISRTVQKTMAIPSLAKFAVVSNDNLRFGEGTEVFGPIHSNGGIRFDGLAHNLISSSMATYTDPDPPGLVQWGVYTTAGADDPVPANGPVNNRPDVFIAGRQFPVPGTDFTGLTLGLTQLQALAQPSQGGKEWSSSGKKGYQIVFKVTGGVTSYDMYKVNNIQAIPSGCGTDSTANSQKTGPKYYQWGTWSIKTPLNATNRTLQGNYPIPANGVIFVNDHVWVEGQVNNARVTIAAGIIGNTDPLKDANITINNNLLYTNYSGLDSIGLIAQGNVNVGMLSANDLRIDAALVAEKGRVGRFYYNSSCTNSSRNSLTLYGMIATYLRYGFAYTDGTGYNTRDIVYDGNLLYGPPPSFPQSTNQYEVISWQQLD
jgi:hypothetical protein